MRILARFLLLFLFLASACKQVDLTATGGSTISLIAHPSSVSRAGSAVLTVSGTRANGAPLPDDTVIQFISDLGVVTPNPAKTRNGIASATFQADGRSGIATIQAFSGDITSEEIEIEIGDARADQIFVSASPASLPLGGGTVEIRAQVTDENGNPLSGIGVVFSTDEGTLESNGRTVRTNENGFATDELTADSDATVTATTLNGLTATVNVVVQVSNVTCDFVVSPSDPEVGDDVFFTDTSSDPENQIRRFLWDFGDGNSGSGRTTEHTYRRAGSFTVVHTITDAQGGSTTCTQPVTVSEAAPGPPSCSFTASPSNPNVGQLVTFDASLSSDSNGEIEEYRWSFGDGGSVIESDPTTTHTYDAAGTFTTTLTLEDDDGETSSCTQTISVATTSNSNPTCTFTISPTDANVGETITFDASLSTDSDGTIVEYRWNFGDNATSNEADPVTTHTYSASGNLTVTLTIEDDAGATASCNNALTVSP